MKVHAQDREIIGEIGALWGIDDASVRLVAARENRVYRAEINGTPHALRLHRAGLRSRNELESELMWMSGLAKGRFSVPRPVKSINGKELEEVGGIRVSVLTWVGGEPLGRAGEPLVLEDRMGTIGRVGGAMAQLHAISDAWQMPAGFSRHSWDLAGLLGEKPVWDRFWDNPHLKPEERNVLLNARARARDDLSSLSPQLDYGLIHADMVRENILIDGETINIIDFDDGGFGYRLFDIATTLAKLDGEADSDELKEAFLDGYRQVRPVQNEYLPLFEMLRSFTYLGWIITRTEEDGSATRMERFRRNALVHARKYCDS